MEAVPEASIDELLQRLGHKKGEIDDSLRKRARSSVGGVVEARRLAVKKSANDGKRGGGG